VVINEEGTVSSVYILIVQFRVDVKSCFCQLKPLLLPDSRTIFELLIANIYSISAARGEFVIRFFFPPIHETRHRGPHCIRLGHSVSCSLARSKAIIFSLGVTDPNYKLIPCQVISLPSKFDTDVNFLKSPIRII
jgi:hypothetical protein